MSCTIKKLLNYGLNLREDILVNFMKLYYISLIFEIEISYEKLYSRIDEKY